MKKLRKNLDGVRPHLTEAFWFGNAYIFMGFGLMSIKPRQNKERHYKNEGFWKQFRKWGRENEDQLGKRG